MDLLHFLNQCSLFLEVFGILIGLSSRLCQYQPPQEVGRWSLLDPCATEEMGQ